MSLLNSSTRNTGLMAIVIGIFLSMTGIGIIIGIPLIMVGFVMFLPEVIIASIIIFVVASIISFVYMLI